MKKILILLLLMVSTSVFAEWTRVGSDGEITVFVDLQTIRKVGSKVKMWTLMDFKTVQQVSTLDTTTYLSGANHKEYDCEEEATRFLDIHRYSENIASGHIVYSQTNMKDEPESVIPGTLPEQLLRIACGKK
jgi:hypothetical protein